MSGAHVLDINDLNFESEVLGAKGPVLLELGARWCPPCRRLEPIVGGIAEERLGQLKVGKLDTDESPVAASRLRIRGVPTVIVFRDGCEIARHVGLTTREKLLALVGNEPQATAGGAPEESRPIRPASPREPRESV